MDKNTYATYEFHSTATDANQFFVVQDDGTFLINRPVPYVAQVQDVKECLVDVQPHTVYDVSSQQFFVDVDNSSELISVSDQFIIPESVNGLYNNSYLLHPTSSAAAQQMNVDVSVDTNQLLTNKESNTEEVDVDAETYSSEESNNFAEITLSDEQYQTLEQKGWILLEAYNKIFILNNLGLHDITANEKLIQKLKNELQNTNTGYESRCVKTEVIDSQYIDPESLPNQQETVEYEVENNDEQDDNNEIESYEFVRHEEGITETEVKQNIENPNLEADTINKPLEPETVQSELLKNSKSMKIKTKLNFKDIPDNIFLGKLVNGKRIVAKVTKRQIYSKPKLQEKEPMEYQHLNVSGLMESQFVNLIQQSVRGQLQGSNTPADVASADDIVTQLLKVPNMSQSLLEQNLIITKMGGNKGENGVLPNKDHVKMVTGRVALKNDVYSFEHIPDMLQNMLQNIIKNSADESRIDGYISEESKHITVFHIHSTEARGSDNIVRISVTLNKRQLSVDLVHDLKRRYPSTLSASGDCATTVQNEKTLKEHIETKYKSMLETHVGPDKQETDTASTFGNKEDSLKKPSNELYKCKMCPSMFFHQATLSKHIVMKHINVKSNQ